MSVPRSKISWTDFSGGNANFVLRGRAAGDCEVSAGCANCYAGAILRRSGATGEHTTWNKAKLERLAKWQPSNGEVPYRRGPGSRPLVFVCDMGDLFHESVPGSFIVDALNVMRVRADVDWQILTKRPARMAYIAEMYGWSPNVWAGTTVENQNAADERIPLLLQVPAKVRFLSCEPLLGPVSLRDSEAEFGDGSMADLTDAPDGWDIYAGIHWVICGGESGPKRRQFDTDWARRLLDQCQAAGVPFFYKQGNGRFPGQDDLLDGRTHKEFPA